jgi:hypothetical protein
LLGRGQVRLQRQASRAFETGHAERAVWVLTTAIETLLALRFVMKLLGAGDMLPHVSLVYAITAPVVAPFRDLSRDWTAGYVVFEPGTLLAMTACWIVGWAASILAGLARQ